MPFVDLTPIPNRATRPDTIDDDADGFFGKLPSYGAYLLSLAAGMTSVAAGGAYGITYTMDASTANSDPGNGKLRFNNATLSSSTALYIDVVGAGGSDVSGLIENFSASTSTIKGKMRLVKLGDPLKWITFDVYGHTVQTGYRTVSIGNAWGVSPSPFAAGDTLLMYFDRVGDKGDAGVIAYMKVSERRPATNGSATVTASGGATRNLNTTEWNDISGASLASNQITLPAGTYEVIARAPAALINGHQVVLRNVTDSTTTLIGSSAYSSSSSGTIQTDSLITGKFTISAAKVFTLLHYTSTVGGGSLGIPASVGNSEVYAEAVFKKVG